MSTTAEQQKPEKPSFLVDAMMRRASGGGTGRKRDLVAEVISVDPEKGIILAKDDQGEMQIEVSTYTTDRMVKAGRAPRKDASHEGWLIDERMAEQAPAGTRIILEGIIDYGKRGKDQTTPYPANWIRIAPVMDSKVATGMISSEGSKNGVYHIFEWPKQGLTTEKTQVLASRLDKQIAAFNEQQAEYKRTGKHGTVDASIGFVVRVHQEGHVLAHTPILHWNQSESRPYSGEELTLAVEYYREAFPETTVEIIPVRVHRPSTNISHDTQQNFPRARTLNGTRSANEPGMPLPAYGKGTAVVDGILLFSTGKIDARTGERKGAENNWVNAVYASGKIYHAMEAVLSSDGQQLKVHKDLELVFPGAPDGRHRENDAPTLESAGQAEKPLADADDAFGFLNEDSDVGADDDAPGLR